MTQTGRRTRFAHTTQIHPGTVVVHNGADRTAATVTPAEGTAMAIDVTFTDGTTARLTGNPTVRR